MKKVIYILIATALIGCKAKQPVISVPVKTVERKVTTLVPFYIPGDSALLRAVFECDSLNRVLLKGIKDAKGSNVETDFEFKDGALDYKAKFKPDTVYVPSDTVFTEKEIPVIVEVPKVEYRQTSWQSFLGWVGKITLIIAAIWGGWKIFKRKLKPI